MPKSKFSHFTLQDRELLCSLLNDGDKSFRKISKIIGCSVSSITNEIKSKRYFKEIHFTGNGKCLTGRINTVPYVCNGCKSIHGCKKSKYYYDPQIAHKKYLETLSNSRSHIRANADALEYINDLVSPLVLDKGQTIDHILLSNEVGISRSTLYRYIDEGLLDIKNVDLKRRVKYKLKRKVKEKKILKVSKKGRKYLDFLAFCKNNPDLRIAELDTVIGKVDDSKCLLTILLRKSNFMIVFLLNKKTGKEVVKRIDYLEKVWGKSRFKTHMAITLTDNGTEFDFVDDIEANNRCVKRTNLFYCDPRASGQKGKLEKNHEYIRYYLPKGASFENLTQDKVNLMVSHINSIRRDSLNGKSPFEMLSSTELKDMKKLGLEPILPNDVILNSKLFK